MQNGKKVIKLAWKGNNNNHIDGDNDTARQIKSIKMAYLIINLFFYLKRKLKSGEASAFCGTIACLK